MDTATSADVSAQSDAVALTEAERRTDRGVVRGRRDGNVWTFRGIPYAAPPVGPLRFRPPENHAGWTGVLDTREFGSICAQFDPAAMRTVGSEDCLTLNVWTPTAPSTTARHVIVWIHGGDNVSGSASDPGFAGGLLYDGATLAEQGDLVFVSIQYRVGAFGFFAHPEFAADNTRNAKGNWGLMDQLAALEWVKRNIAAFGGNSTQVTVLGQSAGADDTCALVASPRAANLFQRAILMSPGGCHVNNAAVSAHTAEAVLVSLDCDGASVPTCMRGRSAEEVGRAMQAGTPLHPDRVDFYVELDGWLLTETPFDAFRAGRHNHMPLVIGTTAEEYALLFDTVLPDPVPPARYMTWMQELFGPVVASLAVPAYPPTEYGSEREGLIAAHGDAVHHCSVRAVAGAAASNQTESVYRYVFGHTYSDLRFARYRAAHGFDLPYALGNAASIAQTSEELALAARLRSAFARFAKTGNPDATGEANWPQFQTASDRYAVVNTTWSTLTGFRDTQCDFWDRTWMTNPRP